MATIRKVTTRKGETRFQLRYVNSAKKRIARNFKRKSEAESARVDIEGKIAKRVDRPKGDDLQLGDVLDMYAAHLNTRVERGELAKKHHVVVKGHFDNYAKNAVYGISGVKLQHLTSGTLTKFVDDIRKDTSLSVVTVRKIVSSLHSAIAFAQERDLIFHNPVAAVKVEGKKSERGRKIVAPSKETVRAVVACCEGKPMEKDNKRERSRKRGEALLRTAILFAASSGLRASEQWALKWSDLDFEKAHVTVSRRVDSYHIEDNPKSAAGFREVPLSAAILNELRQWRLRSGFAKDDDLLFANHRGGYVSHDNIVKRHFLPAVQIAVDREKAAPFNWHALRHFAVSTWIEQGCDMKTVSVYAGHSSIQITADRYGHLFKKANRHEAMNKIADELFA